MLQKIFISCQSWVKEVLNIAFKVKFEHFRQILAKIIFSQNRFIFGILAVFPKLEQKGMFSIECSIFFCQIWPEFNKKIRQI